VPALTKTLNYHIVPGVAMLPISAVKTGSMFATALGPQSQIVVDNRWAPGSEGRALTGCCAAARQ
jgi:hypothetical protein